MSDDEAYPVFDADHLSKVDELCSITEPYFVGDAQDVLFLEAMREIIDWHQERCPFYASLLEQHGFASDQLQSIEDCSRVPLIHANFFKTHEVLSVPRKYITTNMTSSGTTGQKSQAFFDAWSRAKSLAMVDSVFRHNGFETPDQPVNYLLFGYELKPGSKLGTANTMHMLTKFAPANREFCALRFAGDAPAEFDCFGCIRALQEYAEEGLPVRVIGFPAFFFFVMKKMQEMGLPRLALHPDSMTFFAGGWKGHADKVIPKHDLYAMAEDRLGILNHRCRDAYGSVEHSIPYVENGQHHLSVPAWSRVFIRDVKTREPLGYDQPGFLHFVSPYVLSMPLHSVMMGDLAILREPDESGRPWFEILGRAGTSKNRSCAIAASELMGR